MSVFMGFISHASKPYLPTGSYQENLLDCDVAVLYNVETKRINEAVKNNPDRFPEGYLT